MTLEEYTKLTKELEQVRRTTHKAEGVLSGLLTQLEEEFACKTVQQGHRKLERLQQQEQKLEQELQQISTKFNSKWADTLSNS